MQTENDKRNAKSRTKSRAMLRKMKIRTQWAPLLSREAPPARDKRSTRRG
jgi:hypothetical protein